jgi:outer membrane protein OmpA-like peptidoglycan-associated protein
MDQQLEYKYKLKRWILECENGKEMVNDTINVEIENLGASINSKWMEHSPLINADESMMIFTSQRKHSEEAPIYKGDKYFEEIYISKNNGGTWSTPELIGSPINTEKHDATIGISADGQRLFIYKSENNGDIYECELTGSEWSTPKPLYGLVNTEFKESSASFSPDGNKIYFVSNRTDRGMGGFDIYAAYKTSSGIWDSIVNLGNKVNTKYDEEAVFMHPDGRTLYFSSTGHKTMGGFDIFKTVMDSNGVWSKPENLGFPINTPDNDLFLVMASDGQHGYFASFRDGGYGEQDIYKFTYIVDTTKEMIDSLMAEGSKVTIVSGKVEDEETGNPVEADIEVVDNADGNLVTETKSNSETGKYLVALPSGKNYGVTVESDDHLFHSENYDIPDSSAYTVVENNISVKKVAEGSNVALRNIFFDYFSAKLKQNSYRELGKVVKVMNDYPTMKVEIAGHTDNIGPDAGNVRLSNLRAQAVANYLISQGIDKNRLLVKGYGSSKPIESNYTLEGQQKNRRVEFVIISK